MKNPVEHLSNLYDPLKMLVSPPTAEDSEPSDEEFPSLQKQRHISKSTNSLTLEQMKQQVKTKSAITSPTVSRLKINSTVTPIVADATILGSFPNKLLNKDKFEKAFVLYSFSAAHGDEMDLIENTIITILDKHCAEEGWYLGEYEGKKGIFPSSFVQIIDLSQVTPPKNDVSDKVYSNIKSSPINITKMKPVNTTHNNNQIQSNSTDFVAATKTFTSKHYETSPTSLQAKIKPYLTGPSMKLSIKNAEKSVDASLKIKDLQMQLMYLNHTVESDAISSKENDFFEAKTTEERKLNPSNTTISEIFSSYNLNTTSKNFKNAEIQTDETSFSQDKQIQKMYSPKDYRNDSEFRKSISPNLSTPLSFSPNKYGNYRKSTLAGSSEFPKISDSDFSPFSTTSPMHEYDVENLSAATVTFSFKKDETFGVEIYQNGRNCILKNVFGFEWTPLYFSMAEDAPKVGEKAQIHHLQYPKHVIYDILKIIGKSMNEIEINPKWEFKVVENNGTKCFQIETKNGPRLFPENFIVAAFLKAMNVSLKTVVLVLF
uniref:SH3 domain-containing protein n=1 Tax=Panagrolaimus superbus TaxID=310955 RepID=A0A914Y9U6_9BILA